MADRGGGQALALASRWADVTVFVGGLVARDEEEDTDRGSLALPTAQVSRRLLLHTARTVEGGRGQGDETI